MSKRPQTEHAKALKAFILGWISRKDYQDWVRQDAFIIGSQFYEPRTFGWVARPLRPEAAYEGEKQ